MKLLYLESTVQQHFAFSLDCQVGRGKMGGDQRDLAAAPQRFSAKDDPASQTSDSDMKRPFLIPALVLANAILLAPLARSQGFVNLNFESAQIIPDPSGGYPYPYSIAVTNALPGWTVYFGYYGTSQPQTEMTYNAPALGSTFVTLYVTNGLQLNGNCSVLLQGGSTAPFAAITQNGRVPVSAESLLFIAAGDSGNISQLEVSLGGQDLSVIAVSNSLNYTVYGADISAFAGQTLALTFSAPDLIPTLNEWNDWEIGDIQFSTQPVPEPGVLALVALGGGVFLYVRRFGLKS